MTEPVKPFARKEPWDLVAAGYTAELPLIMGPISLAAAQLARVAADARVIDVACGPGTLSLALAGSVREVCAVDFSDKMIAELQRRAAESGVANVHAQVADGLALPFPDAGFDAGFSLFGLMFFADRPRGYRELARVLKIGAPVVVSSWAPLAESSLMELLFGALRASDPDWPPPKYDPESLENPDVLVRELRNGGFPDARVERCVRSVEIQSAEDMFQRVARSFVPLVMLRRKVGEEEWTRRAQICSEFMAARLGSSPLTLSTTAFLGIGRKG